MARPRKLGVERTASGRISRKGTSAPQFYAVYVAAFPCGIVKVGRSSQVKNRMGALRLETGEKPIVCAELHVRALEESKALESHAIAFLLAEGYERDKREWFHISFADLPRLVQRLVDGTPVKIIRTVALGNDRPEKPAHMLHRYSVSKMLSGHRTNDLNL